MKYKIWYRGKLEDEAENFNTALRKAYDVSDKNNYETAYVWYDDVIASVKKGGD